MKRAYARNSSRSSKRRRTGKRLFNNRKRYVYRKYKVRRRRGGVRPNASGVSVEQDVYQSFETYGEVLTGVVGDVDSTFHLNGDGTFYEKRNGTSTRVVTAAPPGLNLLRDNYEFAKLCKVVVKFIPTLANSGNNGRTYAEQVWVKDYDDSVINTSPELLRMRRGSRYSVAQLRKQTFIFKPQVISFFSGSAANWQAQYKRSMKIGFLAQSQWTTSLELYPSIKANIGPIQVANIDTSSGGAAVVYNTQLTGAGVPLYRVELKQYWKFRNFIITAPGLGVDANGDGVEDAQ